MKLQLTLLVMCDEIEHSVSIPLENIDVGIQKSAFQRLVEESN